MSTSAPGPGDAADEGRVEPEGDTPHRKHEHSGARQSERVDLARIQGHDAVERTRAWTGLAAVVTGDVAIALAAILGVVLIHKNGASASAVVSILSSAFTAVGTLTAAYFGIKASANTAKNSMIAESDR